MFSRPKILFLVSLLFVALLNPKFNPYLPFKFLIFYHSSLYSKMVYSDLHSTGVATVILLNYTIVRQGNTATTTITCEALGYPPPSIVWSRANGTLSDRVSVSDSVSVPTGYGNVTRVSVNLIITNASREDTGVYMCSANNSVGSDTKSINITVQCT